MEYKDFEKQVFDWLVNLTPGQIEKGKKDFKNSGDYGVDEDGNSYQIPTRL